MLTLTALLPVALISQASAVTIAGGVSSESSGVTDTPVESGNTGAGESNESRDGGSGEHTDSPEATVADVKVVLSSESEGKAEPVRWAETVQQAIDDVATDSEGSLHAQSVAYAQTQSVDDQLEVNEGGPGVVLGPATVYESPDQEEPIFLYGGPQSTSSGSATVADVNQSGDPSVAQTTNSKDGKLIPAVSETPSTTTSGRENTNDGESSEGDMTVEVPEESDTPEREVAVAGLAQTGSNPILVGLAGLVGALAIAGVATRYYYSKAREE